MEKQASASAVTYLSNYSAQHAQCSDQKLLKFEFMS